MIYFFETEVGRKGRTSLPHRQAEHENAQKLLTFLLEKEEGITYTENMVTYSEFGKPDIHKYSPIEYNYSHSHGLIVCAISGKPVGIDVERIRDFTHKTAARVCSTDEYHDVLRHEWPQQRFFEYWTLKESYCKAIGTSVFQQMGEIHFQIGENGITSNRPNFQFQLYHWKQEYVISVCQGIETTD